MNAHIKCGVSQKDGWFGRENLFGMLAGGFSFQARPRAGSLFRIDIGGKPHLNGRQAAENFLQEPVGRWKGGNCFCCTHK